jgi:hypothetical protein
MSLIPRPRPAAQLATVALVAIVAAACGGHPGNAGRSLLGRSLPSRLPASSAKYVFYVDGRHGSDRNRGSKKRPWKTITRALRTVPLSGSVIKVLPGTYTSDGANYAIVFNRKGDVHDPVTVEAAVPGTVTIANADLNRSTLGAWIVHASGLRVQGLRFRLLTRRGSNVGASAILVEDSSRIEISHCTFNQVSLIGLTVRGGRGSSSNDVWIIDNAFRPGAGDPTQQVTGLGYRSDQYFGSKGSHWIYAGQYADTNSWEQVSGSRNLVVANNLFVGSAAGRDVQLGPQAQHSFVVNNTFYGNRSADAIGSSTDARYAGQGVELFSNSSTPAYATGSNTIANNLFVNLTGAAVSGSGPPEEGNVVLNNQSWQVPRQGRDTSVFRPRSGSAQLFSLGGGNRLRPPRFVDPANYQFGLKANSPALNAAIPGLTYPFDADGRPRPARPAVGAFEVECQAGRGC